MPVDLRTSDAGFEAAFTDLLSAKRETDDDVNAVVTSILADVRARGDAAVIEYTSRFDRLDLTPETLRIPADVIASEADRCPPELIAALRTAADRIRTYHAHQKPTNTLT
ncbi:MAG: histidinol dehydrogenase, partial [Rhodospirillaceae bacterium]